MILINSAAYINSDLISEFGKLPPCMLPVQSKRLYEHQVELLSKVNHNHETIYITLPESFHSEISEFDKKNFNKLDIFPIYIQDGLSIGQAIAYTLNFIGGYNQNITMLHGDTLFDENIEPGTNGYSSSYAVEDNYHWDNNDNNQYFTGYFSINNQPVFLQHLVKEKYDFINAFKQYIKYNGNGNDSKCLAGWKDFGHINTYYRSISEMTTQRSFNDLKTIGEHGPNIICKGSKDTNKMEAEESWFKNIPSLLQVYTPKIFGINDGAPMQRYKKYYMEYFYLSSLANLFVFDKNPIFVWKDIISACIDYLNDEYSLKSGIDYETLTTSNDKMYYSKTIKRLKDTDIDLNKEWFINGVKTPSVNEILNELDKDIHKGNSDFCSIVHGDFCFSNILYDFKSKSIKVIDPRGRDNDGNISIFGDFRYDVAKLAHSVIGMYDYIVAGRYYYTENGNKLTLTFEYNNALKELQDWFVKQNFCGFNFNELDIYIILVHLFLSMIPLHADRPDRQKAFLANALRLYVDYKNKKG